MKANRKFLACDVHGGVGHPARRCSREGGIETLDGNSLASEKELDEREIGLKSQMVATTGLLRICHARG